MNKQEFENQLASATTLITVADDFERKLEENVPRIHERRVGSIAAVKVTNDILPLARLLQIRLLNSEIPLEERHDQVIEVVRSLISWLESFPQSEREDIIRMEATQEGMRRALASIREAGNSKVEALRELEAVAREPLRAPRKPGQRPVKAATIQHAKELKRSMDDEDRQTSSDS